MKRNAERFPDDFLFQLATQEFDDLKSHFATSSWGGRRTLPYAFTEHGALMAANVLKSKTAAQVSIQVVRTFVRLRQMLATHADLARRLDELERKYDRNFQVVFEAIRKLMAPPPKQTREMGFQLPTSPRKTRRKKR